MNKEEETKWDYFYYGLVLGSVIFGMYMAVVVG